MNTQTLIPLLIDYGRLVVLALVALLVGLWLIKRLTRLLASRLEKREIDPSVRPFLVSLVGVSLKVILYVSVASILGFKLTSLVAIIGAAGLAVGLALQGSLQNFAGGVLILLLKPFGVGDYIEAQGHAGTVEEIQIFYTLLRTPDNRSIVIPNGDLSNSSAVNYSAYETRRLDMTFTADYDTPAARVKEVLADLISKRADIQAEPAPFIRMTAHGDSSLDYTIRVWCQAKDYWNLKFDLTEDVKAAFDEAGIGIPYPQMDLHVHQIDRES